MLIEYYTLDELRDQVIGQLNESDDMPVNITRCHEWLFASSILHQAGYDAPEGKFKVQCREPFKHKKYALQSKDKKRS